MQQTVTAKVQINPDASKYDILFHTMEVCCDACNYISDYVYDTKELNYQKVQDVIYYDVRRIYGLRSQMTISCIKIVTARYKAIITNKEKWTKVVFKLPQCDLVWNKDYSIIKNGTVFSVNSLEGRIKVTFHAKGMEKYFDKKYKFGTAKLVYKHKKFFLHIPVTTEVPDCAKLGVTELVGSDRGMRFITTSYDSKGKTTFINGKQIAHKRAHFKELRRELQKKGTPSARKRIKAIGQRENRWVQDVNHCASKALVDAYDKDTVHVIEELKGIRRATEKVMLRHRYEIVSWPYYDFEQKLIYKAERKGQRVIKVDPRYTSQTCPKCGYVSKANRDKQKHIFTCKRCGFQSNDDRVAAMNIRYRGIDYLAKEQLLEVKRNSIVEKVEDPKDSTKTEGKNAKSNNKSISKNKPKNKEEKKATGSSTKPSKKKTSTSKSTESKKLLKTVSKGKDLNSKEN